MEKELIRDIDAANREIENKIAREVVKKLSRGNVILQNGDYLTEEALEAEREFMRNYKFRYPSCR